MLTLDFTKYSVRVLWWLLRLCAVALRVGCTWMPGGLDALCACCACSRSSLFSDRYLLILLIASLLILLMAILDTSIHLCHHLTNRAQALSALSCLHSLHAFGLIRVATGDPVLVGCYVRRLRDATKTQES